MTETKDCETSKGNQKTPSRREFLQYAGLAVGGGTLLAATPELLSKGIVKGAAAAIPNAPLPPHRAVAVGGIHAYADRLSVTPGDDINFYVSSDTQYTMQIYRLGTDPNTPNSDTSMSGSMQGGPSTQPIYPGSYVHVENGLAATANPTALTLECWVRPFVGFWDHKDFNYTGLITQFDLQGAGYGLFVRFDLPSINKNPTGAPGSDGVHGGRVAFYLGNGGAYDPTQTQNLLEVPFDFLGSAAHWHQLQWHHIVATWDGATMAVWIDGGIDGNPQKTQMFAGPVCPCPAPLRLAAFGANGEASHFLNGDLAMPVIYKKALSSDEIKSRYKQRSEPQGVQPPALNGVLGCWPLSEEQGPDVADISPYGRSGRIINHATWQIGGPSFDAAIPRFGDDPTTDPKRGHGLRVASDDLFDCRWPVTQTYTVPANARSGIYVARLTRTAQADYHVSFIVRKSNTQKPTPILLVWPTNTWVAYNSFPFGDQSSLEDVPQHSGYQTHHNFAPGFHFGLLLPRPSADPYAIYGSNTYSHLTRATRFTQVWLESHGYKYDVISDLDLDSTPDILKNYRTVMIAGHSEYWSIQAYNGVQSYLRSKGRLIVLSGNTMYWRVSFSPDGTVMECRKVDGAGAGAIGFDGSRRGEAWHSDDGLRGGLMRDCGFPGWQLTGLETFGILSFAGTPDVPAAPAGDKAFGTFYVTNPNHFLFGGVGGSGRVKMGQAFAQYTVGHESDVRVTTLEAIRTKAGDPLPPGATAPVEPPGITTLAVAHGASICCYPWDYFLDNVNVDPVAELIYWKRSDGGRVFNGGAIANGVALYYKDALFTGLMKNVLANFLAL
jgi:hypothetical protein